MQPKNKKIILIAVTAAAAIGVFLFAPFGTQQIGNTVINGNYYDTPLEAYNHVDASFDVQYIIDSESVSIVYARHGHKFNIIFSSLLFGAYLFRFVFYLVKWIKWVRDDSDVLKPN